MAVSPTSRHTDGPKSAGDVRPYLTLFTLPDQIIAKRHGAHSTLFMIPAVNVSLAGFFLE